MRIRDARFLLVFGGSFDPPQKAHIALPMLVRERVNADAVAYVPAAHSPLKLDREPAAASDRLAMLRLALQGNDRAIVVTDELEGDRQDQPSYTYETLERLAEDLEPNARMRLLIGTDQLLDFDKWKEPMRVISLGDPLVMVRPPQTRDSLLAKMDECKRAFWAPRLIDVPPMTISSTQVRRRIAEGKPITGLVDPAVAKYIHEHELYH